MRDPIFDSLIAIKRELENNRYKFVQENNIFKKIEEAVDIHENIIKLSENVFDKIVENFKKSGEFKLISNKIINCSFKNLLINYFNRETLKYNIKLEFDDLIENYKNTTFLNLSCVSFYKGKFLGYNYTTDYIFLDNVFYQYVGDELYSEIKEKLNRFYSLFDIKGNIEKINIDKYYKNISFPITFMFHSDNLLEYIEKFLNKSYDVRYEDIKEKLNKYINRLTLNKRISINFSDYNLEYTQTKNENLFINIKKIFALNTFSLHNDGTISLNYTSSGYQKYVDLLKNNKEKIINKLVSTIKTYICDSIKLEFFTNHYISNHIYRIPVLTFFISSCSDEASVIFKIPYTKLFNDKKNIFKKDLLYNFGALKFYSKLNLNKFNTIDIFLILDEAYNINSEIISQG